MQYQIDINKCKVLDSELRPLITSSRFPDHIVYETFTDAYTGRDVCRFQYPGYVVKYETFTDVYTGSNLKIESIIYYILHTNEVVRVEFHDGDMFERLSYEYTKSSFWKIMVELDLVIDNSSK